MKGPAGESNPKPARQVFLASEWPSWPPGLWEPIKVTEPDFLDAGANRIRRSISPVDTLNFVILVLAAVLALIAVAGVFNTLLLNTRERARETAVLKALGMTPLQVLAMVAASAVLLGSVGGVLGLPAGVAVHRAMMQALASLLGNHMPDSFFRVFSAPGLILLALARVAVALVGSLLPARWAARTGSPRSCTPNDGRLAADGALGGVGLRRRRSARGWVGRVRQLWDSARTPIPPPTTRTCAASLLHLTS